jgi:hypothetical protein
MDKFPLDFQSHDKEKDHHQAIIHPMPEIK